MEKDGQNVPFVSEPAFSLPPCPRLPSVEQVLGPMTTREWSGEKCDRFYVAALSYAQSLWRQGKPAQAILQLNKALMADLSGREQVLAAHPPPYAALVWILRQRPDGCFLGNPVRHFQHLATRVSGERSELRSWRAWACFHLARGILPEADFPIDAEQVASERLSFPDWPTVLAEVRGRGWVGEGAVLESVAEGLR